MKVEDALNLFHDRYAGAASDVFGEGTTYKKLAGEPGERVLDVGCGDGFLLWSLRQPGRRLHGLDMNASELDAARRRFGDEPVELVRARAQALPFADGSMDLVVSHMALMLMDELPTVIAEIHRVLRPGGRLAAVIGADDPVKRDIDRAFWGAFRKVPGRVEIEWPSGDTGIRTESGLRTLLSALSHVETEVSRLDAHVPVDRLWDFVQKAYYGVGLLGDDGKAELQKVVESEIAAFAVDGKVDWGFPARYFSAIK